MTVITTTVTIVIARPFLLPRVNKAGGFRDEAWPLYNLKPKEVGSTRDGGEGRVRVGTSIITAAQQIPGVRYTARNSKNTIRARRECLAMIIKMARLRHSRIGAAAECFSLPLPPTPRPPPLFDPVKTSRAYFPWPEELYERCVDKFSP